jgi:hypothetical protein
MNQVSGYQRGSSVASIIPGFTTSQMREYLRAIWTHKHTVTPGDILPNGCTVGEFSFLRILHSYCPERAHQSKQEEV